MKPDGVKRNIVGQVIDCVSKRIKITKKMMTITTDFVE